MNTKQKKKTNKYRRRFIAMASALFLGSVVSTACLIDQVRASEPQPIVFYKVEKKEIRLENVDLKIRIRFVISY